MNPRDADPLDVTEQMWTEGWVAGHNWVYFERRRHHRDMLALTLLAGLLVATGFMFGRVSAAPRPGPDSTARALVDQGRTGAPPSQSTPSAGVAREGTATPAPTSAPLELVTRTGILSHMGAGWPADYLALPWGRGVRATLCGPGGCWTAVSNDVGPNQRIHPDRVADVSAERFEEICGVPASMGLCVVTVTRVVR